MSSGNIVGKRYARAIFELAQKNSAVDQVGDELVQIAELIESDAELKGLLDHPVVEKDVKKAVFNQVLHGKASDIVLNALNVIFDKGREKNLPAIASAYVAIANEAAGRVQAVVYSPYPLSDHDITAIKTKFSSVIGKTVEVQNEVDSSLLGGLKVKIGDTLYDGSLSSRLESMRKYLSEAKAM